MPSPRTGAPGRSIWPRGRTAAYRGAEAGAARQPGQQLDAQLALEARLQGSCGATADFREGVAAFLEKRPARFTGR